MIQFNILIFSLSALISSNVLGWTLNTNFGATFKDHHVKVYIDNFTTCENNSLSVSQLEEIIIKAADKFWNKVPTSKLKLEFGGYSEGITNMSTGRLCSPTDNECITQGSATPEGVIPAVDHIVVSCNDNPLNFGSSQNVLGVTIPVKFSGKKITGAVIIINNAVAPSKFGLLSQSDQIAVMAHEIGHAIGLGHSDESAALMYYRTVNLRNNLGQDDIEGVSYLYPIAGDLFGLSEDGILGGVCAITSSDQSPPQGPPHLMTTLISLLLFLFVSKMIQLTKRSK